ncbi:L,D-transpeptidase family protein [uncultured Methylobacterium sp.]|uniref:L,D-transpeptidase family protein n=1 Tax=uncultured Methylobacterium sp. TaxID=157278 RepID=UPI0035CA8627
MVLLALAAACGPGLAEGRKAKAGKEEAKESVAAKAPLTRDAVNAATFGPSAAGETKQSAKSKSAQSKTSKANGKRPDALLLKAQVLLGRMHFSPGAIDGRDGENFRGALSAFAVAQGLPATTALNQEVFDRLQASGIDPVIVDYTITKADTAGPFVEKIPAKMEEQASLEAMGYTDVREMLAERFHMSRDLLGALNPDAAFDKPGTVIAVAAVPAMERGKPKAEAKARAKGKAKDGDKEEARKDDAKKDENKGDGKVETKSDDTPKKVTRIEVDKSSRQVRAFDSEGKLRAFYPASIGSEEKPAPSGSAKVEAVAYEPTYTYDPKYAFKGVKAKEKFTLKPGPNNPVGLVWIDLSIPSYGIHGTPEPEKVGKTESHGCIRLTNWDARELAGSLERGATVEFKDE